MSDEILAPGVTVFVGEYGYTLLHETEIPGFVFGRLWLAVCTGGEASYSHSVKALDPMCMGIFFGQKLSDGTTSVMERVADKYAERDPKVAQQLREHEEKMAPFRQR